MFTSNDACCFDKKDTLPMTDWLLRLYSWEHGSGTSADVVRVAWCASGIVERWNVLQKAVSTIACASVIAVSAVCMMLLLPLLLCCKTDIVVNVVMMLKVVLKLMLHQSQCWCSFVCGCCCFMPCLLVSDWPCYSCPHKHCGQSSWFCCCWACFPMCHRWHCKNIPNRAAEGWPRRGGATLRGLWW